MRRMPVTLAALAVGLAVTFGAALAATPASAHSELVSSSPAQGSTASDVSGLILTFSEAIVPEYSTVDLKDSAGTAAPLGAPTFDPTATVLTIPITTGSLPNGSYVASFRIVSVDGHPIAGVVDFAVAGSNAAALVPGAAISTPAPVATDPNQAPSVANQNDGPNGLVIVGTIFATLVALGLVTVVLLVAIRRNRAKPTP